MFRKLLFHYIIIILAFLKCICINAQEKRNYNITIRYLDQEDGLASKKIHCGMQDSKGFIWFGTSNGLQRYDGKNFKLFTKEKNKLQDNNVIGLVEDDKQQLWISYGLKGADRHSTGKVDIMDLSTGLISTLSEKFKGQLPFRESELGIICSNEKRQLIFVTSPVKNKNSIYHFTSLQGFKKIISDVAVNYLNPNLILFRGRTILFYDEHQTSMLTLDGQYVRTNYPLKSADNIFPISISKHGKCYAATSFHSATGKIYPKPLFMNIERSGQVREISSQFFDKKLTTNYNETFFQTYYDCASGNALLRQQKKGLFLFDGTEYIQLADTFVVNKTSNLAITDYFTTPNNQHWVCTSNGVIHLSLNPNHFTHLLNSTTYRMPFSLDHQTRSIYADSTGNIFINSWGGFYKVSKNKIGSYDYSRLLLSEISPLDGFYYDGINFWISGKGNTVACYEPNGKKLKSFSADSLNLWSGITTRNGQLLIGATDGIGKFKNDHFERLLLKYTSKILKPWVYQFFYSNEGILWAVSNLGLFEFDNKDQIIAHYSDTSKTEKYQLPFSDIHCVYEDVQGVFWMATNGAGLIKWDRNKRKNQSYKSAFKQYTMADGLSSNVLYSVIPDNYGFLWISSEYGLMKFHMLDKVVKTYTKADGLTENEFNRISYFKAQDGRLFFGGMDGVNAFNPNDFLGDSLTYNPPLQIISFNQYNGKKQKIIDKTYSLIQSNQITILPGDEFFTLEFQLLDFENGKRNYAYKIEGVDKEWNYINENTLRIGGLPYGHYILHIKAQNAEGAWSRQELVIPIEVIRPLMSQLWFKISSAFILIIFSIYWYKRRTRALKNAKQALERTVGIRTEQLKNSLDEKEVLLKEIHHRVKNNLQVIVSLLDMQQEKNQSTELQQSFIQAKANVRSISLIHENLYRHENLAGVELRNFIQELFEEVNSMYNSKIKEISFVNSCSEVFLDIDTAVPFGLILNELFTNSYKYAFPRVENFIIKIHLFKSDEHHYEMTYEDNGPGLSINFETAKTMGMTLIKDLSRQIGGKMKYSYNQGSVFKLEFLSLKARKEMD